MSIGSALFLSISIERKLDLVMSLSEASEHNHCGVNLFLKKEVESVLLEKDLYQESD